MKWLETAYIGLMLFIMVASFVAVAVEPQESNPNVQDGGVQLAYLAIGSNETHRLWGKCPGEGISLGDITQDSNWSKVQANCDFRLEEKIDADREMDSVGKGGGGAATPTEALVS